MPHRQRGQTEDAAGHPVSGPTEASDGNSFYRATRMTWLAQTKPGDDSLSAHQTANGLFFYFSLVFGFFSPCDALQVCEQLPMWWHPHPRATSSYQKVPKNLRKKGERMSRVDGAMTHSEYQTQSFLSELALEMTTTPHPKVFIHTFSVLKQKQQINNSTLQSCLLPQSIFRFGVNLKRTTEQRVSGRLVQFSLLRSDLLSETTKSRMSEYIRLFCWHFGR